MFKLFGGAQHKAFAAELVARLVKDLPPKLVLADRKALTANRITRMLERTYASVVAYQKQHRLGMFRRAAFANDFKWEMTSAGYPAAFVDMATECLVIELARANQAEPPAAGR